MGMTSRSALPWAVPTSPQCNTSAPPSVIYHCDPRSRKERRRCPTTETRVGATPPDHPPFPKSLRTPPAAAAPVAAHTLPRVPAALRPTCSRAHAAQQPCTAPGCSCRRPEGCALLRHRLVQLVRKGRPRLQAARPMLHRWASLRRCPAPAGLEPPRPLASQGLDALGHEGLAAAAAAAAAVLAGEAALAAALAAAVGAAAVVALEQAPGGRQPLRGLIYRRLPRQAGQRCRPAVEGGGSLCCNPLVPDQAEQARAAKIGRCFPAPKVNAAAALHAPLNAPAQAVSQPAPAGATVQGRHCFPCAAP